MFAISLSSVHLTPIVAETTVARILKLAKPKPAPYKARARANVSVKCDVGPNDPSDDLLVNRAYGFGSDFEYV
jgi:hypothetical protein